MAVALDLDRPQSRPGVGVGSYREAMQILAPETGEIPDDPGDSGGDEDDPDAEHGPDDAPKAEAPPTYWQRLESTIRQIDSGRYSPADGYPTPAAEDFLNGRGEVSDFVPGEDLRALAEHLIRNDPVAFAHLGACEVDYLWKLEGGASRGRATLGKCIRPTGPTKWYAKKTYVIWLAADNLEGSTWARVKQCLLHELRHTGRKVDGTFYLVPHDVECFYEEVEQELRARPQARRATQMGLGV